VRLRTTLDAVSAHRGSHSFPTRRSSDLVTHEVAGCGILRRSVRPITCASTRFQRGREQRRRRCASWSPDRRHVILRRGGRARTRSEEHTSDSSHVSISYAVFCLKKTKRN